MDRKRKKVLIRCKTSIANDLIVANILDELYSQNVLAKSEYESMKRESMVKSNLTAVKVLIDIILSKDNATYDRFVDSLKLEYKWLHDLLLFEIESISSDDEQQQENVILPHVPKLPPHYIVRISKLEDLRAKLARLKTNETIVLHGMTLIGKSCLVAAAVQNENLLKTFNNKVFWISLGDINDQENDRDRIIVQMYRIFVSVMDGKDDFLTGEKIDTLKIEKLRIKLRSIFYEKNLSNSLLILDKVRMPDIVELFDIGCKTLITTTDLNFVKRDNNTQIIQLFDGFTQRESIALFERCLNSKLNEKLASKAIQIHNICKGYPMLIALIGSWLEDSKDEALDSKKHWDYIIEKLKNYDNLSEEMDLDNKLSNALSLCIKKLTPKQRKYFECLAVFPEDVNITPKVLEILWNENEFEVRRIMIQLEKKSLVLSNYKPELRMYVYGIHHLLLLELRKIVPDIKYMHRNLMETYKKLCSNGFTCIPNDNYMLQYYGYHLAEAELFDKFDVYFNFNFIEAKIRSAGCADLLRDLQIYRKHIIKNDQIIEKKLEEYEKFISEYGYSLCKYPFTNIVQCGLQQPVDNHVYKAACAITQENPSKLYFQLQLTQERHYFTHILELPYNITAASFTNDTNQVLIGTDQGDIIMWEQHYKRQMCRFTGHTMKILHLYMSPNKKNFLSVSEDGSVKLWSLPKPHSRNSFGMTTTDFGSNEHLSSPFLKQNNYHKFFSEDESVESSITFQVEKNRNDDKLVSAAFAHNYSVTKLIATGSERGEVAIWNTDTESPVRTIPQRGFSAKCVAFSGDDTKVIFSCNKNILMYSIDSGEYLTQFCNQKPVDLIFIIPGVDRFQQLIAISGSCLSLWNWKADVDRVVECVSHLELNQSDYSDILFTCGAVTKDGQYLVAGSTDYFLRTYDLNLKNGKNIIVEKYNEGKVVCLDTFFKDNDDSQVHILLVGSENKTVKQWYVHSDVKEVTVKNLPVFGTFWVNHVAPPRIAIINTDRKIQILNGYKLLMETDEISSPVKTICFSVCGDKIAYGLENGNVFEFNYKMRKTIRILSLNGAVNFLKYFMERNEQNVNREGFLVAASENGYLMMYRREKQICFRNNGIHSSIKSLQYIPIVQCSFMSSAKKLLTVAENRTVSVWDFQGQNTVLIGDRIDCNVVSCAISFCGSRLLCILSDNSFEVYYLKMTEGDIELELMQNKKMDGKLTCGCFAGDGNILAFGQDSGKILIWSMEQRKLVTILSLHQSPVRQLAFSPEPGLILVSLGEQIAWWNISKAVKVNQPKRNNLKLPQLDKLSLSSQFPQYLWCDKQGHTNNPYLLSAIKLHGNHAKTLSVSLLFTSFVTVDSSGKIYVIDVLDNS